MTYQNSLVCVSDRKQSKGESFLVLCLDKGFTTQRMHFKNFMVIAVDLI